MTFTVNHFASATYGRTYNDRPNTYFSVQKEGLPAPVALIPSSDLPYGTTASVIADAFTRAQTTLGPDARAEALKQAACTTLRGKPQHHHS